MAQETTQAPRFELGLVVMTRGIETLVEQGIVSPTALLGRHVAGDWGDLHSEADRQANEEDLRNGDRLLSAYDVTPDVRVWVITEMADENGYRHVTTVLLPDEY